MIDGAVHWFGVCGVSNGLAVMADEETRTYWDHMTGEGFQGPLQGRELEVWAIRITTVEVALRETPDLALIRSSYRSLVKTFFSLVFRRGIEGRGFIPPGFGRTMSHDVDPRLDALVNGLGVILGKAGKFYPLGIVEKGGSLRDVWQGRPLTIERGAVDGVLFARWEDTLEPPMQLLTRWYGFSFTYPGCELAAAPAVVTEAATHEVPLTHPPKGDTPRA